MLDNATIADFQKVAELLSAEGLVPTLLQYRVKGKFTFSVDGEVLAENDLPDGRYSDANQVLSAINIQTAALEGEAVLQVTGSDEKGNKFDVKKVFDLSLIEEQRQRQFDPATGEQLDDAVFKVIVASMPISEVFGQLTIPEGGAVAMCRAEAERRVVAVFPLWKQQNLTIEVLSTLVDGKRDTKDDRAKRAELAKMQAFINSVRDRSNELEKEIPARVWDDEHWPVYEG